MERVVSALPKKVGAQLNKEVVKNALSEIFSPSSPTAFCGLEKELPNFMPVEPNSNPKAWKVFERLHKRYFAKVDPVTVVNSTGMRFVTYICSEPRLGVAGGKI